MAQKQLNIEDQVDRTSEFKSNLIPSYKDRLSEELVLALVGPIGSGCSTTADILGQVLREHFGYEVFMYKPSNHIEKECSEDELKGADRVENLQKVGDELRRKHGSKYLASRIIEEIASTRQQHNGFERSESGSPVPVMKRWVHIIDSLKNPDEAHVFKETYGDVFWSIGVFAPSEVRKERLQELNASASDVQRIIDADYAESVKFGQDVRGTFHQADFFLRNDKTNKDEIRTHLQRFLEILFGAPAQGPTKHEASMYAAYAEATKSACLSRQVGAAVVNENGELIGLGRNDVPRYQGGLYDIDDGDNDHRCHKWKNQICHNDDRKDRLYTQIVEQLRSDELLREEIDTSQVKKSIAATDVRSLIEYSRAVHAEMDAIISIARNHKPGLNGGKLYSTTYPCHSCARHIVASGIETVYFIEPYPKSLAIKLHSDSVSESDQPSLSKVLFLQFMGVAPKNLLKLFKTNIPRKKDGKLCPFIAKDAKPIVGVSLDDYTTHEKYIVARLSKHE